MVSPVFNRLDLTLQCLKSIGRLDLKNIEIHIIIVDDGSTDGTEEAIRRKLSGSAKSSKATGICFIRRDLIAVLKRR